MNPFALIGTIFNTFFLSPIVNLLVLILQLFNFLHIPGALGIGVILLTVIIRLLVWPFMAAQMKSAKKMNDLKPHLDRLKQVHGKDQKAYATAQMSLFKEHGYNPAAGCVPSLIQLPIIIALYQAISSLFTPAEGLSHVNNLLYPFVPHLNKMPDIHFMGLLLSAKPSEFGKYGIVLLLVPIITAGLQFIQSKMMSTAPVKNYPTDSSKEVKEKEKTGDTASIMQGQMLYMMPLMIGFFSWQFPIGLALYWNTFTIFGIIQQYKISGLGGLSQWLKKK